MSKNVFVSALGREVSVQSTEQFTVPLFVDVPMAEKFMEGNNREGGIKNRRMEERQVAKLAREILADRWVTSHQSIAITADGQLLDGQHRLAAIIRAGKGVTMNVTFNADPKSFAIVDRNRARQMHYVLNASTNDVAVARMVFKIIIGDRSSVPAETELAEFLEWLAPYLEILNKAPYPSARGRTTTPIRTAIVAHMLGGHSEYAVPKYYAWTGLEVKELPEIILSLLRLVDRTQASGLASSGGGYMQWKMMARAFIAFSPEKTAADRLYITKNTEPAAYSEVETTLRKAYEEWRQSRQEMKAAA